MTPQNYYKERKSRERKSVNELLIKQLVQAERAVQPRIGGLKLHHQLKPELENLGISIGRDRFFEVLKKHNLLLKRLRKSPKTTNSKHNLPVFTNLIKDLYLTGPYQVFVSDITYIRTRNDFAYLSLITDKHSRKIVGYHLGCTLTAQETLNALNMAAEEMPKGFCPIHHSDRGSQYCSHEYVGFLKDKNMQISMTEDNHCAENALAERVNGILKQEYFLNNEFKDFNQARRAVKEAVELYNTRRLHRSLKLRTPEEVHNAA